MIRAALLMAVMVFAGVVLGQAKKPQPLAFDAFLAELERIDGEIKTAFKDRNALKHKQLREERQQLAARVKGAEVTADLFYNGNKLVKRKVGKVSVQVAQLQYGLSWAKVTGKLTDAGEAAILRGVAATGKPGDRIEIKGTVGLVTVADSPNTPNASITVTLLLKSFEAKKQKE